MKKTLLTCITAIMALPMLAQYDGPGFYRIQNRGEAGRYISVQNDKVSEESKSISLSSGKAVNTAIEALQLVKSREGNAGTILYISGNTSGFTIEAQGMNTQKLLNDLKKGDLKLQMSSQDELFTTYQGMQIDLIDYCYDYPLKRDGFCGVATLNYIRQLESEYKVYAKWVFRKIDNENEYFGVNPNEGIKIGNKYYTTLFTGFAYQLSEGMKAYYIDQHNYSSTIAEPIAELKEITDGIVPAATPVIIECSSNDVANNKVTLLNDDLNPITGNQLKGRVFCYIPTEKEDQSMKNALEFNKNTMRILGLKDIKRGEQGEIIDAKLALVSEANNNYNNTQALNKGYIPANKAYLPISSADAAATSDGITLLLPDEYAIAASISKVTSEDSFNDNGIYTLTGIKVKEGNSTEKLPSGIYIIGGKKHIIK